MNNRHPQIPWLGVGFIAIAAAAASFAAPPPVSLEWQTVVNKADLTPSTSPKNFNSFNQPSVNASGLVVFRARSRGPNRESGIYVRDMAVAGSPIKAIADLNTSVPDPNNIRYPPDDEWSAFIEFPSIPRIAKNTHALATRGNHRPVWTYTPEGEAEETRVGTTGVYVNLTGNHPGSDLLTGAAKLGAVPEFSFFAVPGAPAGTLFDVFPGSPAITDSGVIVVKGNYTEDGVGKTGVYFRRLVNAPAGGAAPVQLIAKTGTVIPNLPRGVSGITFGSTAPPSAVGTRAVFVGLDNEENPSYGGIYQAKLAQPPTLATLVGLGAAVPGIANARFTRLGEGLSYDGRFLAFWAAWGTATKTVRLYCPTEGNQDRRDYCNSAGRFAPDQGDPNSVCDATVCYQERPVPMNQGILVQDTQTRQTRLMARTNPGFDDFVYWTYSGRVPGSEEGDDGEPARWRSSSFAAVSGRGASFQVAFKARTGERDANHVYIDPVDGIYLGRGPGRWPLSTAVETGMDGSVLDPAAAGLAITAVGIEREGARGNASRRQIVINASMGSEETGWAGIYLARLSNP